MSAANRARPLTAANETPADRLRRQSYAAERCLSRSRYTTLRGGYYVWCAPGPVRYTVCAADGSSVHPSLAAGWQRLAQAIDSRYGTTAACSIAGCEPDPECWLQPATSGFAAHWLLKDGLKGKKTQ